MPKIIEAIYENGVFKPLQKVDLKEGEKAKIIVESISEKTFGVLKVSEKELKRVLDEIDEYWGFL